MIKRILGALTAVAISASILFAVPALADDSEVILNVKSPGYSEGIGTWLDSSLGDAGGGPTRYSNDAKTAEYHTQLSKGYYQVSIYKLFNASSDPAAKIEIGHNGEIDTITVNYTEGKSEWVILGAYNFDEGSDAFVRINRTGGAIRTGSVRFKRIDESEIVSYETKKAL